VTSIGTPATPPKVARLRTPEFSDDTLTHTGRRMLRSLTPTRIAAIFDSAQTNIADQIQLAHEFEESDDHLRGTLALRRAAVLRLDVTIESGDPDDERANEAAELARDIIDAPWFYRASDYLLRAIFLQWAAVEVLWRTGNREQGTGNSLWTPASMRPVEPSRWEFELDGTPVLYKSLSRGGEKAPPTAGKYMVHAHDVNSTPGDFALIRSVAFLAYLGKLGLKDWGTVIDQFGIPAISITYKDGMTPAELQTLVATLLDLAGRRVIAVPQGTTTETTEIPDQTPHGDFQDFVRRAISKLLLGQDSSQSALEGQRTGATLQGNVRDDIRDGDALLLDASQNETLLAPWCLLNFGPGVKPPRIKRSPPEQALDAAQAKLVSDTLILVREGKLSPDAATELLDACGIPKGRVEKMIEATPIGVDDSAAQLAFRREVVKLFLADGTINDVIYNAVEIQKLLEAVNLPTEPGYEEPWIPVVAQPGNLVTGEPIKDSEGDVVGSEVIAGPANAVASPFGLSRNHREASASLLAGATTPTQPLPESTLSGAATLFSGMFGGHSKAIRTLAESINAGDGSDAEKAAEFKRRLPEVFEGFDPKQRAALLHKATFAALASGSVEMAREVKRGRMEQRRGEK